MVSLRTVTGGLIKDVLPGVEGGRGKFSQTSQTVPPHLWECLSVGLGLRASGGERRDGIMQQCRGIARESLRSLYFPIPYNQDLTAALIVPARCCYLASDSGCQTIISCPG